MNTADRNTKPSGPPISVIVITWKRASVLADTLESLLPLLEGEDELIIIDQNASHDPPTLERLQALTANKAFRWLHQERPSIPVAMNRGLLEAGNSTVLFLDDDIQPGEALLRAHRANQRPRTIVAGRVLQPWHDDDGNEQSMDFSQRSPAEVEEFVGCNFSAPRDFAIEIGGFDENFEWVAYRFEREFSDRFLAAGGAIQYCPKASLRHLHASSGGTRSYGDHLRTRSAAHSLGEYYYLFVSPRVDRVWSRCLSRFFRSVRTRFHLRHPWRIPLTWLGELRGLNRAHRLASQGQKLISKDAHAD